MKLIQEVTALTTVYPTGQKVSGAILTCAAAVDTAKLCADAFSVEGRTITAVHVCGEPGSSRVVLEFSPDDSAGDTYQVLGRGPEAKVQLVKGQVSVAQTGAIFLADGSVAEADGVPVDSTSCQNLVVDEFRQFELDGMWYNLYIPEGCKEDRAYPLVLFLPDASCIGPEPLLTLTQGVGAIGFASPEAQKKHPCFVLAPQVGSNQSMTNNEFEVTEDFDRVVHVLQYVMKTWPVDPDRVYTTGQSMGCMASCELLVRHADLFAAALLVAGQWNPKTMADVKTPLWILVSENDRGAFPGMNAVTEAMEKQGTKVAHYRWNGRSSEEEFTALVSKARKDTEPVRYTVFEDSTVVPEDRPMTPGSNHGCTWELVYTIDALRDWLFDNVRERG